MVRKGIAPPLAEKATATGLFVLQQPIPVPAKREAPGKKDEQDEQVGDAVFPLTGERWPMADDRSFTAVSLIK